MGIDRVSFTPNRGTVVIFRECTGNLDHYHIRCWEREAALSLSLRIGIVLIRNDVARLHESVISTVQLVLILFSYNLSSVRQAGGSSAVGYIRRGRLGIHLSESIPNQILQKLEVCTSNF